MTARCKECGRYIHFGARGTKLKDLCHPGQAEMVYNAIGGGWKNREGKLFTLIEGKFIAVPSKPNYKETEDDIEEGFFNREAGYES